MCNANGWILDETESLANQDLDVSGYSVPWRERAGLVKHYSDAKRGTFNRLIVFKADRLGRNAGDSIDCWDAFEKLGIDLLSVSDGIDTSNSGNTLLRNILLSVAEQESRNASIRITANVTARARAGRRHGGRLPSWLEFTDDGRIVINESVAQGIQRAVVLRLAGESYVSLTRKLNAEGYRTASGVPFQKSYLVKLLQKRDWVETMLGHGYTRRAGRWKTDPRTRRRSPRGEPIMLPSIYPSIISEDDATSLLAQIDASKEINGVWTETYHPQNPRQKLNERWLLSGVLWCAECGSRMGVHVRRLKDRTRRTYFCEAHSDHPQGVKHTKSQIDSDIIETAVLATLDLYIQDIHKQKKDSAPKTVTPRRTRTIKDIDKEISRLVTLYSKETIGEEILDMKIGDLKAERDAIHRADMLRHRTQDEVQMAVSRTEVKQLFKKLKVRIEYPVYLDGIVNPVNYRTKEATPRACARISLEYMRHIVDDPFSDGMYIPLHRQDYEGERLVFKPFDHNVFMAHPLVLTDAVTAIMTQRA